MLFFLMLIISLEFTAPPFLNVRGISMIFSDLFNALELFSNLMAGIFNLNDSFSIPSLDGLSLASTFDFHTFAIVSISIFPSRLLPALLVVMDFGVNTRRFLVSILPVIETGLLLVDDFGVINFLTFVFLSPYPFASIDTSGRLLVSILSVFKTGLLLPPTAMTGDDFGVNSFLTYTFLPPSPFTYVRPFVSVNTRRFLLLTLPVFETGLLLPPTALTGDDFGVNSFLTYAFLPPSPFTYVRPFVSVNTRRFLLLTLPVFETGLLLPPSAMTGDDFGANSFLTYTFLPPSPFTYVRPFVSVNARRPFALTLPVSISIVYDTKIFILKNSYLF
ncbi:hypothetical protein FR483_n402R [Paramecium bursaria Chlorella virus FR483]|uniref:Uncharacterized protein n402R n=1 Tax=Paramecium bursaria Chlorella virus FR483 TaxID=399781 RepID=A7J7A6_PBCVF|nr:hypothetical protein FR483_n402R [Paramecium bursaria Chlorella virus FR483]ABT15687.1 hypothetical protein FR483_n402R [Paramecium bursaria Chlorella virus FR483]